jgi:hypothetical protein
MQSLKPALLVEDDSIDAIFSLIGDWYEEGIR